MFKHRSLNLGYSILTLSALAGVALSATLVGDLERNKRIWGLGDSPPPPLACTAPLTKVNSYTEYQAKPTDVPWDLRLLASDNPTAIVAFPFPTGSGNPCAGENPEEAPGRESILRGITAWNGIAGPTTSCPPEWTSGQPVSEFSMASTPTIVYSGGVDWTDNNNVVTCLQSESYFDAIGTFVIASTPVTIDLCSNVGLILDADIALNMSVPTNPLDPSPRLSWVEWNESTPGLAGMTFITSRSSPADLDAYVDIAGVLTHEVGHLAGLGHSMIDGPASSAGSTFPTMFPVAQVEPFEEIVTLWSVPNCGASQIQVSIDGGLTRLGGVMGLSARTLEADDIAAISRSKGPGIDPVLDYQGAGFSSLGTISGTVFSGNNPDPLAGCVVVAMKKNCPNQVRIATFSYGINTLSAPGEGVYALSGLPPGEYYVYAEAVSSDQFDGSPPPQGYFTTGDLPSFISLPAVVNPGYGCFAQCGLTTALWADGGVSQPGFLTEFYNGGDAKIEKSQLASTVTVIANQVTSNIDLWVSGILGDNPILQVKLTSGNVVDYSQRGVMVSATTGGAATQITYRVTGVVGSSVTLGFDDQITCIEAFSQLFLINPSASVSLGTIPGTSGQLGTIEFTHPVSTGETFLNYYAQAVVVKDGAVSATNLVNTWVAQKE